MPDSPSPLPSEQKSLAQTTEDMKQQLTELVRRSLLQLGDMRAMQDEITDLTRRIRERTPFPGEPARE